MGKIAALIRLDLKSIVREPLLIYIASVAMLGAFLVRWLVPKLEVWLASKEVVLANYYAFILGFTFILQSPMLFGIIVGFFLLDEREENVLSSLRITPMAFYKFLSYRFSAAIAMSTLIIGASMYIANLVNFSNNWLLWLIAFVASLQAPIYTMLTVTLANNKIEAMAVIKGISLPLLVPAIAYFITSQWKILFGIIPTYWTFQAFCIFVNGYGGSGLTGEIYLYLLIGTIYQTLGSVFLYKYFSRRIY